MKKTTLALLLSMIAMTGCADRPAIMNSDPTLNKPSTQFAADAAVRHPFKATAPAAGEAKAKADVDYMFRHIQLANLSNEDWTDVEIWINRGYVLHIPKIEKGVEGGKVKTLSFNMFFDGKGNPYQSDDLKKRITQVEVYRNGKVYNVPLALAD